MKNVHVPVLLQETLRELDLAPGLTVVDATLGGGGHSKHIAEYLGKQGTLIALDQDEDALERAQAILNNAPAKVILKGGNFKDIDIHIHEAGFGKVDRILFDLGLSTNQLELSGRGFSFNRDEPLLMTMSKESNRSAYEIVNTYTEEDLADLIYNYGEERYARRIAAHIVEYRKQKPVGTSGELSKIIEDAVPSAYKRGRIHASTRTFQAIRIATNDELESLRQGLHKSWEVLNVHGRILAISFHSLEDRIVKQFFASLVREKRGELISKKPITATEEEIRANPKSRSAKLRIIKKLI